MSSSDEPINESHVRPSSRTTHRKRPSVSLFPDPSRLQFATSHPSRPPPPAPAKQVATNTTSASTSAPEESLTGLAKARQRAMNAKMQLGPDQSGGPQLTTSQPPKRNFPRRCGRLTCQVGSMVDLGLPKLVSAADPILRMRSTSPNKLRRKLSRTLRRRSKSVDFDAGMKMSISAPIGTDVMSSITSESKTKEAPKTKSESAGTIDPIPKTAVSPSQENNKPKKSHSTPRLMEAAEIKNSRHTRQASSVSSTDIDISPSSESQSDVPLKRSHSKSAPTTQRQLGISPEQAARNLPSSVKSALGLHAHTESMGYMVLFPHEVVQLNDVTPKPHDNPS